MYRQNRFVDVIRRRRDCGTKSKPAPSSFRMEHRKALCVNGWMTIDLGLPVGVPLVGQRVSKKQGACCNNDDGDEECMKGVKSRGTDFKVSR